MDKNIGRVTSDVTDFGKFGNYCQPVMLITKLVGLNAVFIYKQISTLSPLISIISCFSVCICFVTDWQPFSEYVYRSLLYKFKQTR